MMCAKSTGLSFSLPHVFGTPADLSSTGGFNKCKGAKVQKVQRCKGAKLITVNDAFLKRLVFHLGQRWPVDVSL